MSLKLSIISIEQIIFTGEVDDIILPGEVAPFEILPSHAPIISTLVEGVISFSPVVSLTDEQLPEMVEREEAEEGATESSKRLRIKISGGIAEMNEDVVTICVTL